MSIPSYIAVVSDMDGTLLLPDHTLSYFTRSVVDKLQSEHHIPLILATGRHHTDVLATKRRIDLKGYLITSNGARAHDPDGNVILRRDIDPILARELACIATGWEDITTSIYQGDYWYMNRDTPDLREYYQENKEYFYPRMFDPASFESYDGVYKVYYTSDNHSRLKELEQIIKEKYSGQVYVAYSLLNCMEVTAIGVNKGISLAQVLKNSIFPNDPRSGEELLKMCIAFGDGENDAQMLMMAGTGCVMENAQARLLNSLSIGQHSHLQVIGSNADDGVARKLVQVFGLE